MALLLTVAPSSLSFLLLSPLKVYQHDLQSHPELAWLPPPAEVSIKEYSHENTEENILLKKTTITALAVKHSILADRFPTSSLNESSHSATGLLIFKE